MASPCTNDPNEVISAVVGIQTAEENFERALDDAVDTATENADKFDAFVNGTDTQTVQLGEGAATPTIRNTVRQMMSAAATLDSADVSGKSATANGGSEMRTLAERFSDIISVKDYGAKGDGATDDSAAIKAALLAGASQGKAVYIPGGEYVINSTQLLLENINNLLVFGNGQKTSVLKVTNSMHVFRLVECEDIEFNSFGVVSDENVTGGNTFQIEDSKRIKFKNIYIEAAGNDAICLVTNGFADWHSVACNSYQHEIISCLIHASKGGAGVRSLHTNSSVIFGCNIQECHHEAICCDYGSYGWRISTNIFSSNGGAGQISLDGGSSACIVGNSLTSGTIPCIVNNGNLETTYACVIVGNHCHGGTIGIWLKGLESSEEPGEGETNYYGSNRCIVVGNVIRNATLGIRLDYRSKDNVVFANSYTNCNYSIRDYSQGTYNWILPERSGLIQLGEFGYSTDSTVVLTDDLPESNVQVTASVSGWVEFFYNSDSAAFGWRGVKNETNHLRNCEFRDTSSDFSKMYIIPVRKGDKFSVMYPDGTSGHTLVIKKSDAQVKFEDLSASYS